MTSENVRPSGRAFLVFGRPCPQRVLVDSVGQWDHLGHRLRFTCLCRPVEGFDIFSSMVAGVLFIFGFIVAATLGCTAGSVDLTEGMFRHLVVTGRSRLALYLARIPAGLAIIVPMVAAGFTIVCLVCVFAAPTHLVYDGVTVPPGLSHASLDSWASEHADEVVCNFNINFGPNDTNASAITEVLNNVPCGNRPGGGPVKVGPGAQTQPQPTQAQIETVARLMADQNYADYSGRFLSPSISLMVKSGLWIELYAAIGFLVGLGLSSLIGQRTVPVILLIVLELVLTPLLSHSPIAHLVNVQRGLLGLAATHFEPGGLPSVFGGHDGGGGGLAVTESTAVAISVLAGWVVVWTVLGAWRMATRDAWPPASRPLRTTERHRLGRRGGVPHRRERGGCQPRPLAGG